MSIELQPSSGPDQDTGPLPFASGTAGAILAAMATATSPVFVGRATELDRLLAVLERAESGRPAVALVAGDAGVGKTRLLTELAGRAGQRGARVLVGGCMEVGDVGLPYVPFVDAFRELGSRPGEAELAAPLIAAVPGLGRLLPMPGEGQAEARPAVAPSGPQGFPDRAGPPAPRDGFEQVQLLDGVLSLLVRLSELAPLLLVIEDLHWADPATRHLFAFLVRTLRTGRIALVASYRSDELHRRHPLRPLLAELVRIPDLERVELPPFNRAELTEYLEALVGEGLPSAAVDRILRRSEGNAFFAEELVAAGAARAEVLLPEALADVLLSRVEARSELAREVLKVAAVAGRRVGHRLLVAAAGRPEPELEQGLREAIAAQVLVMDPVSESYRFRHALLQEVVYGDLLPGERSRLHATYARLLADPGPAAELAHHCMASHDLPGALAALVRAAADATAVSAQDEALHHLTQAIELWDRVPDAAALAGVDRAGLLLRAAEAASNSGEFRHAVGLAREAVAAIDAGTDAPRAALAWERLGNYLLEADDDIEEAFAAGRRAVELVDAEPPTPLRARVTAGLARLLLALRRYDEARRWCDEALTVARAVGSASEETYALVTLAVLELRLDNPDVGRSLLRDARGKAAATCERSLELRAQYSLAMLELDSGNLAAARPALDEAVALAEGSGLTWSDVGVQARVLRCFAYYVAGLWDEAERLVAALDERSPAAASLSAVALYVEVGRGRAGAAERLARLVGAGSDDTWAAYLAGGCGADLARWQGDLDQARALAGATLAALDAADEQWELSAIWPATLGLAAEADRAVRARATGDEPAVAEAVRAGQALLEWSRAAERRARTTGRQIGPEALAWLARAEAEWARLSGRAAPERWEASAGAFGYGYLYEEARSRWRLAEALLAVGRRDEALAPARAAHATALRLGAGPLRGEVEALARRARLDLGPGVAPGPGPAGLEAHLTPRELEVLRLVAAGRSNQQIAAALFISPKTASVHVSNILAKLGVHSRVEAAATAHRLGLDGE
jgi:DNA-binding NarL/FixJ family response regulator